MSKGIARNTAAVQQFLNFCPAVIEWRELDGARIEFDYDPAVGWWP